VQNQHYGVVYVHGNQSGQNNLLAEAQIDWNILCMTNHGQVVMGGLLFQFAPATQNRVLYALHSGSAGVMRQMLEYEQSRCMI
jgi:hypothetical protein